MASASSAARLCLIACRQVPRLQGFPRAQHQLARPQLVHRALSTTTGRWEDGPKGSQPPTNEANTEDGAIEATPNASDGSKADASLKTSLPATETLGFELLDYTAKQHGYNTFDQYVEGHLRSGPGAPLNAAAERKLEEDIRRIDAGARPEKQGFWFDEDDPETNTQEHDEFDEDDITEMAHGKLEEIREMRHYQRLAVWELPLLSKFAKPFEPPADEKVLRWRYTTYMGDNHPAEKKVVVQFAPDDLGLTDVQADKLKKLAGPRFNPETELVKMSCESYPHPAQNKRYLSKLVDDLVAAAKDPKDTFEDIPLDVRHHRFQPKPRFPKEWFMTEERRKALDENRQRLKLEEVKAVENGELVDGKKAIESYLLKKAEEEAEKQKVAELLPVDRLGKPANLASRARR